jgi:hypothetical protein
LKIKIFLWQLFQNAILTRDNLKKRKWGGSPLCSFCQQEETMTHLFFECSNAKVIWGNLGGIFGNIFVSFFFMAECGLVLSFLSSRKKISYVTSFCYLLGIWNIRNKITFEKAIVRSPLVTIAMICSLLHYWAGLFGREDGGRIKLGADQMLQRASALHSKESSIAPGNSSGRQ